MSSLLNEQFRQQLQEIESAGLLRRRRVAEPVSGGKCLVDGRELWDFSNNDYLSMSTRSEVIEFCRRTIETFGVGARASVLISGWTPAHQELRESLARFCQAEDSLLFSSGYTACMGTISTLVDSNDIVFCDKLNHASLVDGCRMSGAKIRVFRHDHLDTLERELKKSLSSDQNTNGRRWIVSETLFGMDGAYADLRTLLKLAEDYDAFLICDEAHATGVYGPSGEGYLRQIAYESPEFEPLIESRVVARMGTLSKAFGSQGGFVLGSRELVSLLWNTARPAMFSTGLSIANCAAAIASIQEIENHPEYGGKLRETSREFRRRLTQQGLHCLGAADCPIVPLVIEDPVKTLDWGRKLEAAGFLVGAVRPPTVPQNTSRLRISLNLSHTPEILEQLLTQLHKLQSESGDKPDSPEI